MKNYSINQKTIEFFKKNGKNIVCSTLAAISLMVPFKAKLESQNEELVNTTKIEEMTENEELVFLLKTEWKKTNKYSDGKGPVKENREYERTISRFVVTENFNEEYFNNDYQKLFRTIRDTEDVSSFLKIIGEEKEVIVVSEEEEKKLDLENWHFEVEGTNIKASITNPTLDYERKNETTGIIVFSIISSPLIIFLVFLCECEYNLIKEDRKRNKQKKLSAGKRKA